MIYIVLILLAVLGLWLLWKMKVPKVGAIAVITGAPKTGKTTLAVHMALRNLRWQRFKVWLRNHTLSLINRRKWPKQERPLLYSNIPLTVEYVPMTQELLMRKKRFVYRSVILLSELSLVADMMLFRNMETNERLDLFCKLIGHETRGGLLVWETQAICDAHMAFKRTTSQYFYIHSTFKYLPFFIKVNLLECRYSEDGSALQTHDGDIEDELKYILIPKKVWKTFDPYCYSCFTDNLPVERRIRKGIFGALKAKEIISFRNFKTISRYVKNDEETNQDEK